MRLFVFSVLCLTTLLAVAEKQPFERYQSIIDRQMFGQPPRGFDPTKMPSEVSKTADKEQEAEQEKLKSSVVFSAINVSPSGEAKVAFTDNRDPKSPRYYYMKIGETNDGWTVTSINPKTAEMTAIYKNGIEVSLKLGGDSSKDPEATSKSGGAPNPPSSVRASNGGLLGSNSLRSRRQMREQIAADQAAKAEQAQKERDEREAAEKAQREEERAQMREQLMKMQETIKRGLEARQQAEQEAHKGENNNPE